MIQLAAKQEGMNSEAMLEKLESKKFRREKERERIDPGIDLGKPSKELPQEDSKIRKRIARWVAEVAREF
jgi:hypothetical protein